MGGLLTANAGISTTAISTNSAYIGALRVAGETNTGNLVVTSNIAGGSLTITTGATNLAALTASGLVVANGGISTTAISTNSAYIGSLTIGNASDAGFFNIGGLLTANAGISTTTISSISAYISTFSTTAGFGNFSGKFTGDGSGLTGVGMSSLPPVLSTSLFSTGLLTACNVSTNNLSANIAFISSLTVNALTIGPSLGFLNMGDIITTSISTNMINASTVNTSTINLNTLSASFGVFSTISTNNVFAGNVRVSTLVAESLSSYIVMTSSLTSPNVYVTNIYANGGTDSGIVNIITSSLNASKAVFIQVLASSFIGTLSGQNILTIASY
jgi:hypothetical protein